MADNASNAELRDIARDQAYIAWENIQDHLPGMLVATLFTHADIPGSPEKLLTLSDEEFNNLLQNARHRYLNSTSAKGTREEKEQAWDTFMVEPVEHINEARLTWRGKGDAPTLAQAFAAKIAEAPDDDSSRNAYADHLEDEQNPRGEFMRLQLAAARGETLSDEDRTRIAALLTQHGVQWAENDSNPDLWPPNRRPYNICGVIPEPVEDPTNPFSPYSRTYDEAWRETPIPEADLPIFQRGMLNHVTMKRSELQAAGIDKSLRHLLTHTPVTSLKITTRNDNQAAMFRVRCTVEDMFTNTDTSHLKRLHMLELSPYLPLGVESAEAIARPTNSLPADVEELNDHSRAILRAPNQLTELYVLKANAINLNRETLEGLINAPHLEHTILDLDIRQVAIPNHEFIIIARNLHEHNEGAAAWQQEALRSGKIKRDGGHTMNGNPASTRIGMLPPQQQLQADAPPL